MYARLKWIALFAVLGAGALLSVPAFSGEKVGKKIRVVLIDGQNNHKWRETTPVMKKALEDSGRFTVDVATSPEKPKSPQKPKQETPEALAKYKDELAKYKVLEGPYKEAMAKFRVDFSKYDVVLSNYNGDSWPKEVNDALDSALKSGKIGLVIVHAANNSFGGWDDYNKMIGMGWRNAKAGERLYLDDQGKSIRVPAGTGEGSGHRYVGEFDVTIRDSNHPVTKGMPPLWRHTKDELYDNMRGPIENIQLLATAYSKGTMAHEPMIWTVSYGKGRVFHTPLGHDASAMRCVGFITTLLRGTEWAATGDVTQPIPATFPTAAKASTISEK